MTKISSSEDSFGAGFRHSSSAAFELQWLSKEFGCILEVPGCYSCCPVSDPRMGGYRFPMCIVTQTSVDTILAPSGSLGALAIILAH
mmetsp:Transcript_36678/g.58913  ORF Transcript_36678/g.58913 Transcript_36678/m.58913 type:complete len:87 (-) Transcript_36678:517-777(-)